ncbi:BTB/POZ and MATH domain-containing protein 4 [Glycine max]|nr:BTB/POZ and MATH domain-containing protein 4 [Glycine max]
MSRAMCNPAMVSRSVLGSQTSSKSVTETMSGFHEFVIKGYSLTKGMGIGKYIVSETFIVGGFQWAIYFFPDGRDPKDNAAYVSVFVALHSKSTNVRALFDLTLLDLCKKGEHKVHSHFSHSLTIGPYTLINHGSMWLVGYTRFFKRRHLETSNFLKDDCLKINCTIAVLVSSIDSSQLNTIQVPESDIGEHFGMLLEDEESFDVTFSVGGERFHAHKLVLAARSTMFETQFFNAMKKDDQEIVVIDMEPKALLHFVYRDTLLEDEELFMLDSSFFPSLSESFIAKLLAAGEKYGLPRLMLMCESILCKEISVDSVAYIFALADRYCATHLKSICQKVSAENFDAVMHSDGFEYLKKNCPLLQSELLKTGVGCEKEFS